jgi:hypothetical protein
MIDSETQANLKAHMEAFNAHLEKCQPMIEWLNENATHLSDKWDLHFAGGGFTQYRAIGEFDGKKCEFAIIYDDSAEPNPVQEDPDWVLVAQEVDDQNEIVSDVILIDEGEYRDMRELVIASRDLKPETLEWKPC